LIKTTNKTKTLNAKKIELKTVRKPRLKKDKINPLIKTRKNE
jgi:hypothetical protein